MLVQFGDIEPFLTRNEDIGPSLRPKLLDMIRNVNTRAHLQMELAAVIDVSEHFVKATYNLEDDGPLVLRCYEETLNIRSALQIGHFQTYLPLLVYMLQMILRHSNNGVLMVCSVYKVVSSTF